MQHLPLTNGTKWIKFFYDKDTGNIAFDDFSVTTSVVGLNSHNYEQSVSLYPTPTEGLVNIIFADNSGSTPTFSIYNLLGSKISEVNLERINANRYTIDLRNQYPGLYLVKIQTLKGIITRRITVK